MMVEIADNTKTMLPSTIDSAYNDPGLVGGGVRCLQARLHHRLFYCSNHNTCNGKHVCGRLMSDGFDGDRCPHCDWSISPFVDHVIELQHLYPLLMQHSDLLQRIADYYPISISRLSQGSSNQAARVWCTESAYIARRDFERNPTNFILDIVPKLGDVCYYSPDCGSSLLLCDVTKAVGEKYAEGMYTVKLRESGKIVHLFGKDRSQVQKIGGLIPINVVCFDDGAEVFKSSSMTFSDNSRTEEIQNIAKAHRRRPDFCCFLGTTSGGKSHPNVREKNVWYEKQRRLLSTVGTTCSAPVSCFCAGRRVVVHRARIVRNEYHRSLDHPELVKQGTMSSRNVNSMNPFMTGFKAVNTKYRALYCYLMNTKNCDPIKEADSVRLFAEAEALVGTEGWEENAQATGVKMQSVAAAGAEHHNLAPDPTQNHWSRIDMGAMHFLGIVDDNFREFLISLASPDARRRLSVSPYALRQPPGQKKLHSYVKVSKTDNTAEFTKVDEKLHQKKKWRQSLMLYDLKNLFEGTSARTVDIHRVIVFILACCLLLILVLLLSVHRHMAFICHADQPIKMWIWARHVRTRNNCSSFSSSAVRSSVHQLFT